MVAKLSRNNRLPAAKGTGIVSATVSNFADLVEAKSERLPIFAEAVAA
ncbi:hypothetical protein [Sphingomonas sp. HMP9]|nr:hypothetical protein [Sphingomonas sp. HMP9]